MFKNRRKSKNRKYNGKGQQMSRFSMFVKVWDLLSLLEQEDSRKLIVISHRNHRFESS